MNNKLKDFMVWPPFLDEGIEEASNGDFHFHRAISMLGPVNGIYCIYHYLVERWVGTLVLWNSATREYKHILPPVSFPFPSHLLSGLWNSHWDYEMNSSNGIYLGFWD